MEEKIDKAIAVAKGMIASRTHPADIQQVAQSILSLTHVRATYACCEPSEEMNEELTFVLGKVRSSLDATALVQITQAAVHLVNARANLLTGKTKPKKQGSGA